MLIFVKDLMYWWRTDDVITVTCILINQTLIKICTTTSSNTMYVELGRFSATTPCFITEWDGRIQKSSNRMILLVLVYTVFILCAINHGIVHFKKRFQILKRPKMEIILHFTFLTIYYHIISAISHKIKYFSKYPRC